MVASEYYNERDGRVDLLRKTMPLIDKDKLNTEVWYSKTKNLIGSKDKSLLMAHGKGTAVVIQ